MEKKTIWIGQPLPEIELNEGSPLTSMHITDICSNKKVLLFGVMGAFTPGCSTTHVRGYLSRSNELKRKGYQEIICVTVNDVFVTEAWAKELNTEGKIRILADPNAEFVKALGLDINIPTMCGPRSKHFSMTVVNNVVKQLTVEPDSTTTTCTFVENLIF